MELKKYKFYSNNLKKNDFNFWMMNLRFITEVFLIEYKK